MLSRISQRALPFKLNCTFLSSRQFTNTAKIGIIGGSGPDAGINFMQDIFAANRKNKGAAYKSDRDAADVVLFNNPLIGGPHGEWDLFTGRGDPAQDTAHSKLLKVISGVISDLKNMKCDRFAVACNTLHVIEPQIQQFLAQEMKGTDHSMDFYSIIEPVKDLIVERAIANKSINPPLTVAVYGSLLTSDLGATGISPYRRLADLEGFEEYPFQLIQHDAPAKEDMQDLINMIKREAAEDMPKYIDIMSNWMARDKADLYILGCTEFSLMIDHLEEPDKFVDPVNLLAVKLVQQK